MTESDLTRSVAQMIRREFSDVWFYKVNDRFTSGLPDLLLCVEGQLYGIELKIGKNKPTKLQQHFIDKINACGGRAICARSVDEVRIFLKGGEKK